MDSLLLLLSIFIHSLVKYVYKDFNTFSKLIFVLSGKQKISFMAMRNNPRAMTFLFYRWVKLRLCTKTGRDVAPQERCWQLSDIEMNGQRGGLGVEWDEIIHLVLTMVLGGE